MVRRAPAARNGRLTGESGRPYAGPMLIRGLAILLCLAMLAPAVADARGRKKKAPARNGTVLVQSSTTGAQVWVDGQLVGEVPMALPLALRSGRHTIKVTLAGHADYLDTFNIASGKDKVLEIDLLAVAGVLRARAQPADATVVVDGRALGAVPYEGELEPGRRVVELRAPGYAVHRVELAVDAGQVYPVDATLVPLPPPEEVGPTPWYGHWWVWAGAAAVVATGVTVALVAGGDDLPADPPYIVTIEPTR